MKQAFILMALCTLFMYSCTVASHSTGTTTTKVYVHDTTRIISTIVAHDNDTLVLHDTLRLIIRDTVWKGDYVMYDTVIKHDTINHVIFPSHDTIIKHDTVTIHDSIPAPAIKKDSSTKTLYLRDLGIIPNTGECLTDKLLQVINKAVAAGGKTTLIFSDEGEYRLLNGTDFLKGLAPALVTFKYDCYPNDIKSPLGLISIKPCK